MTIQRAIEIAKSNDYEPQAVTLEHHYLLDPLFFQALGKGLGWEGRKIAYTFYETNGKRTDDNTDYVFVGGEDHSTPKLIDFATYQQLQLIIHLDKGNTIESWFESLSE